MVEGAQLSQDTAGMVQQEPKNEVEETPADDGGVEMDSEGGDPGN